MLLTYIVCNRVKAVPVPGCTFTSTSWICRAIEPYLRTPLQNCLDEVVTYMKMAEKHKGNLKGKYEMISAHKRNMKHVKAPFLTLLFLTLHDAQCSFITV